MRTILLLIILKLIGNGSNGFHRKMSNEHWNVRPSPSNELSVLKLQEPIGLKYDPKPSDLNPRILRLKLGKNFDSRFMSVRRPSSFHNKNGTIRFPYRRSKHGRLIPIGKIPNSIKNLKYGSISMPDGTKIRTRISPKLRRKLMQFLWAYTSCPIYEKWRDLGIRFWPRWLKEGYCDSERSCSIPPSMSCIPSQAEYKVLLRWHCQDWEKSKKCRWIPIRHPVITACTCKCTQRSFDD